MRLKLLVPVVTAFILFILAAGSLILAADPEIVPFGPDQGQRNLEFKLQAKS